jgi:hypothetical protein
MSLDKKKNRAPPLARITILFSVLIILVFFYIVLMEKLLSFFPFLDGFEKISTPIYYGRIPGLNLVGYISPLVASAIILLVKIRNKKFSFKVILGFVRGSKWWFVAGIAGITISFLIPSLSASGRTDYPLTIVVVAYVAVNLNRWGFMNMMLSSFVLGYVVGFISDLQSQVFFTGYFGGGGFLDGDFLLPTFLCIGGLVSRILIERVYGETENQVAEKGAEKLVTNLQ